MTLVMDKKGRVGWMSRLASHTRRAEPSQVSSRPFQGGESLLLSSALLCIKALLGSIKVPQAHRRTIVCHCRHLPFFETSLHHPPSLPHPFLLYRFAPSSDQLEIISTGAFKGESAGSQTEESRRFTRLVWRFDLVHQQAF